MRSFVWMYFCCACFDVHECGLRPFGPLRAIDFFICRPDRILMPVALYPAPCEPCAGTGLVPHERRTVNGQPDLWDQRTQEVCSRCGGTGKVKIPPSQIEETKKTLVVGLFRGIPIVVVKE